MHTAPHCIRRHIYSTSLHRLTNVKIKYIHYFDNAYYNTGETTEAKIANCYSHKMS